MTQEEFTKRAKKLEKRIQEEFPESEALHICILFRITGKTDENGTDHCPTALISVWGRDHTPTMLRRYADLLENDPRQQTN